MSNSKQPEFSQHLFLMGNNCDERITDWFGGALIIEHDISELPKRDRRARLMRSYENFIDQKITKLTEVISGSDKGLVFAKMSGTYPIAITQRSAEQRDIADNVLNLTKCLGELNDISQSYDEYLCDTLSYARSLQGEEVGNLEKCQAYMTKKHTQAIKSIEALIDKNLRGLMV